MPQSIPISSISDDQKASAGAEACTFHGFTAAGNFMLMYNGLRRTGIGTLYKLKSIVASDGRSATTRVVFHKSAKAPPRKKCEISVPCFDAVDGSAMRFRGSFIKKKVVHPPAVQAAGVNPEAGLRTRISIESPPRTSPSTGEAAPTKANEAHNGGICNHDTKAVVSTAKKRVCVIDEGMAEKLAVARAAKLDVDLKLPAVCFVVGESRASVCRKIKSGAFPQPIKRDRTNFWTLREIDAYRGRPWDPMTAKSKFAPG